ncbi:hypothetical protein ACUY3H_06540 [Corynebacterium ureicelerivorans]
MKLQTKQSVALTAAALALVAPLTACGSDDEGSSGGLSTAAEAPASASAANASTEESADGADNADDTEEPTATETTTKRAAKDDASEGAGTDGASEGAGTDGAAQSGNGGQPATLANPFENGVPQNTNQPLPSGTAGSDEDRKQMEATARAVLNPGSWANWASAILDNSCKAVSDQMMQELERQGLTLQQVEEASRLAEQQGQGLDMYETDVSISDVRVDGNRASASLTARSEKGEETSTMIFQKEDGRWKLCN